MITEPFGVLWNLQGLGLGNNYSIIRLLRTLVQV